MNAIAFYVLAALVVLAAAAAVSLPRQRDTVLAVAALCVAAAVLFAVAGGYAVAVAQVLIPAACAGGVWVAMRRGGYRGLARPEPWRRARWLLALPAIALGVLVVVVLALSGGAWHVAGGAVGSLITVLHYRAGFALMLALVLAVTGVAAAVLIGRTSADERELDRATETRRLREERERRRREDREAARRRRGGGPVAEEEA